MFNKKLGNNGSTLLMVIIVTAVLSILGTVMLSITLMNTSMKYNDLRSKKSMYLAESGIDQVYTLLSIEVDEALKYAQGETQDNMQDLKTVLAETFKDDDEHNHGIYPYTLDFDNDGLNDDFNENGIINSDTTKDAEFYSDVENRIFNTKALQNVSNAYFRKNFAEYFDNNADDPDKMKIDEIKAAVESITKPVIDTGITNEHIEIRFDDTKISNFSDDSDGSQNLYTIRNVTSKFQYGNITDKEITTDIVIKLPEISPVSITNKIYSVENNPIWQNALVSEEVITFKNNTTNIDGNIYAYGKIPTSDLEKLNVLNYKGINLKSTSTKVDINGDMVSKSDIKTIGPYSQLKVEGDVYCNTLMTYKDAISSEINIKGKVYTYDDLELNANGSEINIDGKYYGFSIGNDDNIGHDNSSSILINADISSGAKLKIDDNDSSEPDIYIGGTSYINTDSSSPSHAEWPYQTGESFSVKGNYLYAYTSLPSDGTYSDTIFEETVHGFELAVGNSSDFYNVDDKIGYFYKQYSLDLVDGMPKHMEVGDSTSIGIDIDSYGYSLGNIIGIDGPIGDRKNIILESKGSPDIFQPIADNAKYSFYYYLNNFKPREGTEPYVDPNIDNIVEDSIDFITGVNIYELDRKTSVLHSSEDATEVIYVSDSSSSITISGEVGHSDSSNIKLLNGTSKMQGLIVTKGDVKIVGPLDFTGTIITTGNITIEGGEVNLTNTNTNKDFLAKIIRSNPAIRMMFRNFGADFGMYTIESEKDTELFPDEDPDSSDLMNSTYHELIYIDNWQVN